jgi:hypothetical protein
MRRILTLMGLMVVPMLVAADDSAPPAGWKEYSPKDKSFSVWLPEKGGRRSERERTMTVRGQRIKVNLVQVETRGGLTYGASTLRLPPAMTRKVPIGQRIEISRDAFLEEVKGKVNDEKDINQGRVPGKEYMIQTGRGLAKLRVFALGGFIYRVSVVGSKAQVESKDAETFLESYKLPERATTPPADKEKAK